MADTGAKVPTGATTTPEDPWLDNAWANPTNIYGAGEASVTAATFDNNDQTEVLKAYGFDFSAIGDSDEILGVIVTINARADTTSVGIDLVQLLDVSRAKVGTNKSDTSQRLTTGAADYNFGAADDKWGNELTPAWVKDPDFGVAIGGHAYTNNSEIYIDSVTITVYYAAHDTTPDRYPNDSVGLTDAQAYLKTMKREGADAVGVADSAMRQMSVARSLADAVGLSDAIAILLETPEAWEEVASDAVGVSDATKRTMTYVRNIYRGN